MHCMLKLTSLCYHRALIWWNALLCLAWCSSGAQPFYVNDQIKTWGEAHYFWVKCISKKKKQLSAFLAAIPAIYCVLIKLKAIFAVGTIYSVCALVHQSRVLQLLRAFLMTCYHMYIWIVNILEKNGFFFSKQCGLLGPH